MDLSKSRIAFLAGTLSPGGAERQLFYILRSLQRHGAHVRLLCLSRGEFWEQPIRNLGTPVHWVGESQSRTARLRSIVSELKKWPPDYLQSQHFYTNAYAAAAARLTKIRDIGAMRNDGASEIDDSGRCLGWLNLYLPKVLAGNSHPALAYAQRRRISKSCLFFLPNVVDTEMLTPKIRPDSLPVKIVLVGRLEKQKRVDRFLNVLARLRQISPVPIKGIVIGTGSLEADLIKHAGHLGLLPEAVEFRGTMSDMQAVYHEADILALTSDHEGTPNVVLEAMATGLPVVATRVGGVPDIIQHGVSGFLSDVQHEECLVEALLRLVTHPSMRREIGKAARDFVVEKHSPDTLLQHLTSLYEFRESL